jgi:sugar lactone lactonase YvrE
MSQRLIPLILSAGVGVLLGGQLVLAADRIDLFDTKSNRTGYVIVDPKTKRFDTYNTKSKRTGWGTITRESGDVQVYDKDGNRIGSGTLPAAGVKR